MMSPDSNSLDSSKEYVALQVTPRKHARVEGGTKVFLEMLSRSKTNFNANAPTLEYDIARDIGTLYVEYGATKKKYRTV